MGKTFICYSHQDKERFVQGFYKRLLELGVDVSIDELDIIPGDNFPRKIFEECIDNCENFIIILSKNSINSEWVNEELDAGMVQKIEKGARLIPIIIDDLNIDEVPNRLRHITHHSVNDISNYDTDAKRIANICLGLYEKPEVKPPKVNKSKAGNYPSLSKMDAFVFDTLVDIAMQDDEEYIGVDTLLEKLSGILSYEEIEESLEVLKSKIYIDIRKTISRDIGSYTVEIYTQSIVHYLMYSYEDVDNNLSKPLAAYLLANIDSTFNSQEISSTLGINHFLLRKLLDRFNNKNYIMASDALSRSVTFRVEIAGRRYFREVLGN